MTDIDNNANKRLLYAVYSRCGYSTKSEYDYRILGTVHAGSVFLLLEETLPDALKPTDDDRLVKIFHPTLGICYVLINNFSAKTFSL
jgi:hypothetical protein